MNKQTRVLYIIDSLKAGGAERSLLHLLSRIDRSRFVPHVAVLSVLDGNPLAEAFAQLGLPLVYVGSAHFYSPMPARVLARYIAEHEIDLLHTQLTTADVLGRLLGFALGKPVVSTLQNEFRSYRGKRFDRRALQWATARWMTDRLVVVTDLSREAFIEGWGLAASRIQTIHNAIEMAGFLSVPVEPQRGAGEGPLVTNIGRLHEQKGQQHLLAAAMIVLQQRPDARFWIVGRGPLEQELKARAEALGLAGAVTFTGLQHDIPAVLAASDIFVLSSLWEGLPLAAIEAMAAARPPVLTDVGGARELVEPGVHGLLVPPADPHALAEALLALLNDPRRRVAMGQAARERVRHEYSNETIAREYEALYEAVLAERGQRRRVRPARRVGV